MEEKYEKLISGYKAGNQTESERSEMEAAIAAGHLDLDELDTFTHFNNRLLAVPVPTPSERLRSNFYQMLAEEKRINKTSPGFGQWLIGLVNNLKNEFSLGRLAYGLILISLGVVLGLYTRPEKTTDGDKLVALTAEMQQLKKMMMLTLLEQPAATERLKAVNLTADMEQADDKVIRSLLQTLNNDPDVNVRLAAIEALYLHAGNPVARAGLVSAINNQESPLVQLALADVMVAMQERTSVKALKQLLQQEDLNDAVKEKVKESLQILI